ncbi:MAG: xylulokinase [Alphaproteobacteria bacterium]|nr:xylulokinase [Alphaproteobacteria bacterium]MCW5740795.1 xylulokinase [Alphaproteobacteria bacterium]
MYLGIDIGTSGVKSVLVDEEDAILAEASAPLGVSRPRPQWSEQDPRDWWRATEATLDALAAGHRELMGRVRAIGLSGQMLGVALLDGEGEPLRPALLWSDGRAARDGHALEAEIASFASLTGARAMAGFCAPKLRWLTRHEPEHVAGARWILLPKDHVRLHLCGEAASDRADSSATLLMDTTAGDWSDAILECCGVRRAQLPRLVESAEPAGTLRATLARRWGLPPDTPVAGGAGDNMCGGVGAGVVADGDACISLGTSGVYFVANRRFAPSLDHGMHTHRHAVRGLYCQQAVVLSAAAALSWVAGIVGAHDIGALVAEVEQADIASDETPLFAPYLGGERTPHDDLSLTAAFAGLGFATERLHLVQAVMEGVALALRDCQDALESAGATPARPMLIGGGARSRLWTSLIASALDRTLSVPDGSATGPALGAARLARAAVGGKLVAAHPAGRAVAPDSARRDALAAKRGAFADLAGRQSR